MADNSLDTQENCGEGPMMMGMRNRCIVCDHHPSQDSRVEVAESYDM